MEVTHAIGRRKTSVARIYLKSGKGKIVVNNEDFTNQKLYENLKVGYVPQNIFLTEDLGWSSI